MKYMVCLDKVALNISNEIFVIFLKSYVIRE